MNTPAQLIIGSDIYEKLSQEVKITFLFFKRYQYLKNDNWNGDNYFYDDTELIEFWGVKKISEINGDLYYRDFKSLSLEEEEEWKKLSINGNQIKIFWC